MFDGDKLIAKVPLSWKTSFSMAVVIPPKMRKCIDCKNVYVKIVITWLFRRKNLQQI